MSPQRAIGFAMVAVEAAIFAHMSGSWIIPALAAVIALLGAVRPLHITLSIERRVFAGLGLAVFFAIKWRLLPEVAHDGVILNQGIGINLAEYVLVVQAALFHIHRPRYSGLSLPPLPVTLPGYGITVLACAGDYFIRGSGALTYQVAVYIFVALAAVYIGLPARSERRVRLNRPRMAIATVTLVITGAIAWVTGYFLAEYRYEIDRIFLEPFATLNFGQQFAGFSGGGRLGSIQHTKNTKSDKAALRVFSKASPEYLRGRIFTGYSEAQWDVQEEGREITPGPRTRTVNIGPVPWEAGLFSLAPAEEPFDAYEVWTASAYPVAFMPADTAQLAAPQDRLRLLPGGEVNGKGLVQYAAYVPRDAPAPLALSETERQRCLALPPDLDPRIVELAHRLTGDFSSPQEKMAAVANYFRETYRYEFGIQVPPGRDPLEYFLLDRPPAHCEYFATGTAILLRIAGVPARYVTGFVAAERNEPGGYWVARNRDAHAWVEAWNEEAGWTLVEATPEAGVPQPKQDEGASAWMDNLRFMFQQLRAQGFRAVARWLGHMALTLFRLALIPVAVLLALTVAWRAWRRLNRARRTRPAAIDPALAPILRLRVRVDNALSRQGLQRAPTETIHQFAQRLGATENADFRMHAAAAWYREYAEVRYGKPLDEETQRHLAQTADRVIRNG